MLWFKPLWVFFICSFIAMLAWEYLYFSIDEGFLLGLSLCISVPFLNGWYKKTNRFTEFFDQPKKRIYLHWLPLIPVVLYLITLRTVASWDVVDAFPYIVFYMILGIAWLSVSFTGMLMLWSFSYEDDVLTGNSQPSLVAMTGAMLGVSLIYAGANIGDGPGWWTVVFAGGLGTITWLLLGALLNKGTDIVEKITIDHDLNGAFRWAAYLTASGLILARASAGDWTSAAATVIEFIDGWPVIPLVIAMFAIERFIFKPQESNLEKESAKTISTLVSILYLVYALLIVVLLPSIL